MKIAAVLIITLAVAGLVVFAVTRDGGTAQDPPGAGHGPADIVSEQAGTDTATGIEWQKFTVQGVSVLIPGDGAKNWLSNLNTDICDPLLAQYFVVENVPTGTRFRVDLQGQEIRFNGTPNADVQAVADTIQRSFSGSFTGDPRLSGKPQATPTGICDRPRDDIPTIDRAFEPSPAPDKGDTEVPEAPATPAPMPTPVISNQQGENGHVSQ